MQYQSDSIKEISIALSKVQAKIQDATKNSTNPHFKSKYADLSAVLEVCRPILSEFEISFTQTARSSQAPGGDCLTTLVTTMMHSSGEWITGEMPLLLTKRDMQGMGSAITYARRYSLASMCGIAQEDDDGNEAAKDDKPKPKYKSADDFARENKQIEIFLRNLETAPTSDEWKEYFQDAKNWAISCGNVNFQNTLSNIKKRKIEEMKKLGSVESPEEIEKKSKEMESKPDADPKFFEETK